WHILSSYDHTATPGASAGTRNTAIPLPASSAGRTRANTTNSPAIGALVMNRLPPSITQPSPSGVAVVFSPDGSEPASGSVSANAAVTSPDASDGSQRSFCASVPNPTSTWPAMPLLVPNIDRNARLV